MINLDKLDPDWNLATQHGIASKSGIPQIQNTQLSINQQNITQKTYQICPCCYEHVHKDQMSIRQHSKQLQFLGFGFPLFYGILKYCIVLLIISIATYNAFALKSSIQQNYQLCYKYISNQTVHSSQNSKNSSNNTNNYNYNNSNTRSLASLPQKTKICLTFMVEIAEIADTVSSNQQTIRIASFILQLLALLYIRNSIIKLGQYYDERTTSLSDYAIFIKRVPKIKGIQKKIKQFFIKQFEQQHEIKQITLLPQYHRIQQLQIQKTNIINKLRPFYDKKDYDQFNKCQQMIKQQSNLKLIQEQLDKQILRSKQQALNDEMECQKIICVFDTEKDKQQILDQFQNIQKNKKVQYFGQDGAKSMYVKQAPQPNQIIWRNANLPRSKRIILRIFGWGLSLLIIAVAFTAIYFILQQKSIIFLQASKLIQKDPHDQFAITQYRGAIALVYILIFMIVLFDKLVLATLFHKFTDLQRHSTTSKFQFSFSLKLTLGLFFTTALMTLAVQAIRFHNYYQHSYGVIDQQTIMFFINSSFVPLIWLINPTRIFKLIKRKINFGKRSMTQRQANQLMQQQRYDVGKRLAQIMEMMWFTYFYSTLIPIGVIITCIGLTCYYWVDKCNLLKRSTVVGNVSVEIIHKSLTLLDFTLILFPIGSLIFDYQVRQNYVISSIVMIVVAFVYIILPKNEMLDYFYKQKFYLQEKTYTQVKHTFHKTYHTQHPIYRKIYHEKLKKKVTTRGLKFVESIQSKNFFEVQKRNKDSTYQQLKPNSQQMLISSGQIELGLK